MGKGVGQSVLERSYEELNGKENNCECRGLMWALLPISACRHLAAYPDFPGHLDPAWEINSISNRWLLKHVFFYRFDPLWPELKWISLLSSRPPHLAFKVGLEQKSQMEEFPVTLCDVGYLGGEKAGACVLFWKWDAMCALCKGSPTSKGMLGLTVCSWKWWRWSLVTWADATRAELWQQNPSPGLAVPRLEDWANSPSIVGLQGNMAPKHCF